LLKTFLIHSTQRKVTYFIGKKKVQNDIFVLAFYFYLCLLL